MPKAKFTKVLTHPNRNIIVRMLKRGESVRHVAKVLKEMHPNDKSLHLTTPTLQKFRNERLKLDKEVISAIKEKEQKKKQVSEEKMVERRFRNLPAFKEAVAEAAQIHVDIRKELQELLVTTKARTEHLFNRAAAGELSVNEEGNLHKYLAQWTTTIERWAKYIEKVADKTVETNVNINVIEDQIAVIRTAVKETIEETMDAEAAMAFMRKLGEKVSNATYRRQREESFQDIYEKAKELGDNVKDAEVEDD